MNPAAMCSTYRRIASGFYSQEPGVTLQNVVLADGTAATAVYGLERPALALPCCILFPVNSPPKPAALCMTAKR